MDVEKKGFGLQPLDAFMVERGLANTDLVRASPEQLTHKMVAKARSGRRITVNIKNKVLKAFKVLYPEENFKHEQFFNY